LTSVPGDLRRIAEFFSQFGYTEALGEVRLNPTSNELRTALSQWLNSTDRSTSDTAVIYYSGHGDSYAGIYYLLTGDTRSDEYAASALRADYMLEVLGENPRLRRVLVILDACFAGGGAFDTALLAARMSSHQQHWADGEGVWVVVASSSWQMAEESAFSTAFTEAAARLQKEAGRLQPYIALEALIDQVNSLLADRGAGIGQPQLARQIPVTGSTGLAPFIPNPRYEPHIPPNLDLETAAAWLRRRRAAELAGHWDPKSRGVEVAVQAGHYFTGRETALKVLTDWLADPDHDTRIRVLTGGPGSGKSAVLGRLVTVASASPPAPQAALPTDPASPAMWISAALLAKGKTAAELLEELADTPGLGMPDKLADGPLRPIIIDALDEASDPPSVIEKVISSLCHAASAGHGPRIVVATRPNQGLLSLLPGDRVTINLDAEPYSEPADVAGYVAKILLAADDPDSPSPYRYRPEQARAVAAAAAEIAGHSFLIAQIAARTLARTPYMLDRAEVAADRERWRDVGTAFDQDLARYGADAQRIRALLTPLAWAEGGGLPRELWATLATALGEARAYTDDDVTSVLAKAGAYVVEALESERSVYRLYHQQFAEHLRIGLGSADAGRLITARLRQQVPVDLAGRPEWIASSPYIRTHLATHAAAGGLLDDLLTDPKFLLASAPDRLLAVLGTARATEARRAGEAFRRARPWLSAGPSQLLLAALQVGAKQLAEEIMAAHPPAPGQWRASWAWWLRPTPALTITTFDARSAHAVAVTRTEAVAVAVVAVARRLECWDLDRSALLAQRPTSAGVNCVTPCDFSGTPAIAVGDQEGTLAILSVPGLEQLAVRPSAHPAAIKVAAAVDGHSVVVTGDEEGGLIAWALPSLETLTQRSDAHTDVLQLAAITIGSELYVISAGDWAPVEHGRPGDMPTLRMWTGSGLEPSASWAERRRRVPVMGVLNTNDRVAVLVDGPALAETQAEVWTPDVTSGRFTMNQRLPGVEIAGLVRLSDDDYLICTPDALIPLSAPRPGADPATLGLPVEAEFAHWAGPVTTNQGDALVSATGTLRLWTLQNLAEESARNPVRTRREEFTVASLAVNDSLVYASTADGHAHAWNIASGEPWHLAVSSKAPISAVGAVSDSGCIILGLETGELQLWDNKKGRPIWRAEAGEKVISVQVLPLDDRMIALAAVQLNWELYVCRIWDVESGTEIESRNRDLLDEPEFKGYEWNLAVAGYRRDKPVTDLAAADTPHGPLAAVASRASVIPVWSLTSQEHVAELLFRGDSRPLVLAFAPGYLFAGGTNGELFGWRLSAWWPIRRDKPITSRAKRSVINVEYPTYLPDVQLPQAHYGPVQALVGGTWNGRPCAVTGGRDGRLQAWTVQGDHLATVDIGEPVTALVNAGHGRYAVGTERGLVMIESA
jgi:WD40 repeat protein